MNILMLAQNYPPEIGGEELHVRNLSVALTERGHQVTVVTMTRGRDATQTVEDGVTVRRVVSTLARRPGRGGARWRPHAPPLPDPGLVRAIARAAADTRPDIVHAHDWIAHSYLPLARRNGPPFVVTLHDYGRVCTTKRLFVDDKPCAGPSVKGCLSCGARQHGAVVGAVCASAVGGMRRPLDRAVDSYIAVSAATARGNALGSSGVSHHIVPNFVLDTTFDGVPDQLDARFPSGDFLLFVGDLDVDKGIRVLLTAFERLRDRPPLVLVGRVPDGFATSLPDDVHVLGMLPHHQVLAAFRRCTVAVVPSVWDEPFGYVVLEAMGMGAPIVASANGGIPEIIEDGVSGRLVPPGDAAVLADGIGALLGDAALRERLEAGGRRRAGDFTASRVMPRIEGIYTALLSAAESGAPRRDERSMVGGKQ